MAVCRYMVTCPKWPEYRHGGFTARDTLLPGSHRASPGVFPSVHAVSGHTETGYRFTKACAALGLEAERATPKHLGTPVPRTCMHAFGTAFARRSGEPLGFRPKEGTCASKGAHAPGETSTSRRRRSALMMLRGAALLGATERKRELLDSVVSYDLL